MSRWRDREGETVWQERWHRVQHHPGRKQPYTVWDARTVIQFTVDELEAIFYAECDREAGK